MEDFRQRWHFGANYLVADWISPPLKISQPWEKQRLSSAFDAPSEGASRVPRGVAGVTQIDTLNC